MPRACRSAPEVLLKQASGVLFAGQGEDHGGLNPSLENFKIWLAKNKDAIPLGTGAASA